MRLESKISKLSYQSKIVCLQKPSIKSKVLDQYHILNNRPFIDLPKKTIVALRIKKNTMTQNNKRNIILIGEDIETRILFKNAFSKLENPCSVDLYTSVNSAMSDVKPERASIPYIIFLDTNNSADACTNEVRQIRASKQFKDCSLVVYDSRSHLRDTQAIFSEGADAFINQPYYFPRLRKVLENVVNIDWNFNRFSVERASYFL